MEEYVGEAFAANEQRTIIGKRLNPGEAAPDFTLDYFDVSDLVSRTVHLADSARMVRLLNVVNTLERPICQRVTRQWEDFHSMMPPDSCIYTVSMDPPQVQARWQEIEGVLHQMLSAHRSDQFGQDYGVWLKRGRRLARAVFVLDRADRIAYAEYLTDQLREPDYAAALQAVQQTALA